MERGMVATAVFRAVRSLEAATIWDSEIIV